MSEPLRVLSLGAGVQSTTVLLRSLAGELPRLDAAIFADTGWEPAGVYDHLLRLEAEAARAGLPVLRVSAGNIRNDALDPGHRFASMPLHVANQTGSAGMLRRQCTKEYKIGPIHKALVRLRREAGNPRVEQWFGISCDEPQRMRSPSVLYLTNACDGPGGHVALSNWDTLAFDQHLQPGIGSLTSGGLRLEIYKNWLYLHDEAAWREGGSFRRPVIGQIWHGCLDVHGLSIRAIRGPADGVYVAAWHDDYADPSQCVFMAGCGVYGWDGSNQPPEPPMPATDEEVAAWLDALQSAARQRPDWLGVSTECLEFLLTWLTDPELGLPAWTEPAIAGARDANLLRFNQGDLWLADRLSDDDEPPAVATKIGEQAQPLLLQMLPSSQPTSASSESEPDGPR